MLAKISNWLETSEILIQLINFFLTFYNQLSTLVQLHSSIIIHYQLRTSLFALVPHTRITSLMNAALDQWLISACKKKISCPGSPIPTLELNRSMTDCHNFRWTRTIDAVFIVLWYFPSVCLGGPFEKVLLDSLMKNYNTQNRSHLQKKKYLNHSIFHY